jgi:hypothetical protein
MNPLRPRKVIITALASLVLATSIGRADEEPASVKGTVIVRGAPLAQGRIFFHFDEDQMVGAKIKNGNYSVKRLPPGECIVTVEGEGVRRKYTDDGTSGLRYMGVKGSQKYDELALDELDVFWG